MSLKSKHTSQTNLHMYVTWTFAYQDMKQCDFVEVLHKLAHTQMGKLTQEVSDSSTETDGEVNSRSVWF
jgi:hypothetical protein